jgi:hypothetical protein
VDPGARLLGRRAQRLDQVGAQQGHAVQPVAGQASTGHVAQELAVAGPQPLAGDREPGLLDRREAAERLQRAEPVDGQAHERPDRSGRVGVRLVDGDLGADAPQRDRAGGAGHAPSNHDDLHNQLLNIIH